MKAIVALALCGALAGAAHAQDPRDRTLVLVAPPAVLLEAVQTSLAPWQIHIVVIAAADAPPGAIADAHQAGFVAIGTGGELHLYDRGAADEQRRPMPADLDEADAAALALTIKTWMRLGPEPATIAPVITAASAPAVIVRRRPPTPPRSWRITAGAAIGARANQGGLDALHARLIVAAGVETPRVEVAIGVELGPQVAVADGPQAAEWREIVIFARASRRFALPHALSLRPVAGLSLLHVAADGHQMPGGQTFGASDWNVGVDGAVELGWRSGRLETHVILGLTGVPVAQRLHDRSVKLDLPAHLEPWAAIGAETRF